MFGTVAQINPQTWAEIAEKLGIPFAIVLLLFFFMGLAAAWLARHVVKPVTSKLLGFVDHVQKTNDTIVGLEQQQIAQGEDLKKAHDEHDRKTIARLDRVLDKLEKGCPLLNGQAQPQPQVKP